MEGHLYILVVLVVHMCHGRPKIRQWDQGQQKEVLVSQFMMDALEYQYRNCSVVFAHDYGHGLPASFGKSVRILNDGYRDVMPVRIGGEDGHSGPRQGAGRCFLGVLVVNGTGHQDQLVTGVDKLVAWGRKCEVGEMLLDLGGVKQKLAVVPVSNDVLDIYVASVSGQPQLVGRYRPQFAEELNRTDLFPEMHQDLYGEVLVVPQNSRVSTEGELFWDVRDPVVTKLLESLGQVMNFTWNATDLDSPEDYDLALVTTFGPIPPGSRPAPGLKDGLAFATARSRSLVTWRIFFTPFTPLLWTMLGVTLFISGCLLHNLLRWEDHSLGEDFEGMTDPEIFIYSFDYLFRTLISQTWIFPPVRLGRVFMAFWWIFVVMMLYNYNARLVALLAVPPKERHPETYQQLLESSMKWGASNGSRGAYQAVLNSSTVLDTLLVQDESHQMASCLVQTLGGQFACLSTYRALKWDTCSLVDTAGKDMHQVRFGTARYTTMQSRRVFRDALRDKYTSMSEAGLVSFWEQQESFTLFLLGLSQARNGTANRSFPAGGEEGWAPLSIERLFFPFFVLVAGAVGGFLCVAVERDIGQKRKKKWQQYQMRTPQSEMFAAKKEVKNHHSHAGKSSNSFLPKKKDRKIRVAINMMGAKDIKTI